MAGRQIRIGPFVVMDELEGGASSRLFRARYRPEDGESLGLDYGATVVLKVLRPGKDLEAMTREAELLVLLDHPGIVHVLHRGMTGGRMWLALEYIEGESVRTVFEAFGRAGSRMQPQVALALMADICEALAVVHTAIAPTGAPLGMIHRDLSPTNLLLDVYGQVHIIDFGEAILGAREQTENTITGTPGYLSPEQARGERLTQASDVYALGIVLFELVTGVRAFPDAGQPDAVILDTHAKAIHPPWPAGADVSSRVRVIVDQCMHQDPGMRPQDASALYHMIAPMVRDQGEGRRRLSLAARDLVRSNHDRPAPLFL